MYEFTNAQGIHITSTEIRPMTHRWMGNLQKSFHIPYYPQISRGTNFRAEEVREN